MHVKLPIILALLLLQAVSLLGCQLYRAPIADEPDSSKEATETQPTLIATATLVPTATPTSMPTPTPAPTPAPTPDPTPEPTMEPDPLEQLVVFLNANGFAVEIGEQAKFLLSVPTTHLRVGERDLFSYVFEADEASLEEAAQIGTDGSSIGRRQLLWPEPPSFFAKGRLILFLINQDQDLLETLVQYFGPRFAGGDIPGYEVVPIVHD